MSFKLTPLADRTCESCPLYLHPAVRKQVPTEVHPAVDGGVDVMFIAEAPGQTENAVGRPVVGVSGKILRRVVTQINGSEEGVAYGNVVRCRPTNEEGKDRKPSIKEINTCKPNILDDIRRINPKRIVICGKSAAQGLALNPDTKEPIDPATSILKLRGLDYVVEANGKEYPATITYHFAYVARNPVSGSVFKEDIGRAFMRARNEVPDYSKTGRPAVIVDTVDKVYKLLKHMVTGLNPDQIVAMDYETAGINRIGNKVITVGFAFESDRAFVIPYEHVESPWTSAELMKVRGLIAKFFRTREAAYRSIVPHNSKFEAAITTDEFGEYLGNVKLEDTMLRAHALNENRKAAIGAAFGLKALADEWLGFKGYDEPEIKKVIELRNKGEIAYADLRPLCDYNGMDCYVTHRLFTFQEAMADREDYRGTLGRLGLGIHGPESAFAAMMERNGIRVDMERLEYYMTKDSPILKRQRELEGELYDSESVQIANRILLGTRKRVAGMQSIWGEQKEDPWVFSINKAESKQALYLDVLGLEAGATKSGRPSIDKAFYKKHKGVREVDILSEWTALDKLRGTYIEGIYKLIRNNPDMRDGRVRAAFNFHTTATSRTSSDSPNMQNIPKGKTATAKAIKSLYIVDEGHVMVCADYSQAEVRWLAEMTGDTNLINAFQNVARVQADYLKDPSPENEIRLMEEGDFHRQTAAQLNDKKPQEVNDNERGAAKCVHPKTLVFSNGKLTHIQNVGAYGPEDSFVQLPKGTEVCVNNRQSVGVTATYNGGKKELLHIVARRGVLTCSETHRIALADGTLKKAGDIKKGDIVDEPALPKLASGDIPTVPINVGYGIPPLSYTPTLETAYFAGLFLGDGAKMSNHSVAITHGPVALTDRLGITYERWQDEIVDCCKWIGLDSAKKKSKVVYLGGRHVMKWLAALELIEHEGGRVLSIPQWVLSGGEQALMSFLGGLYDTDGTVAINGHISVTTKDAVFAGQIAAVLRYFGLHPSLDPGWNRTYKRWYYRVRLPVSESGFIKDWLRHPGKAARMKEPTYSAPRLKPNEVLTIVPAGKMECLDLSVDSPKHLYCANGFTTHNSIVFGLIYGMSAFGLASRLNITVEEAEAYQEKFLSQFPQAREWLQKMEGEGFANGFVESPIGRRRHLVSNYVMGDDNQYIELADGRRMPTDVGKYKSYEDRVCRNAPIQSIASDTNLMACIAIQRYILDNKKSWRLINIVHDSIIAEIPFHEVEAYVEVTDRIMIDPNLFKPFGITLKVPFKADFTVGPNWGDQLDVEIIEQYTVSCKDCGEEAKGRVKPSRCGKCNSTNVDVGMAKGPLKKLLRYLDYRYRYTDYWKYKQAGKASA